MKNRIKSSSSEKTNSKTSHNHTSTSSDKREWESTDQTECGIVRDCVSSFPSFSIFRCTLLFLHPFSSSLVGQVESSLVYNSSTTTTCAVADKSPPFLSLSLFRSVAWVHARGILFNRKKPNQTTRTYNNRAQSRGGGNFSHCVYRIIFTFLNSILKLIWIWRPPKKKKSKRQIWIVGNKIWKKKRKAQKIKSFLFWSIALV
jgi:hypothetical protein